VTAFGFGVGSLRIPLPRRVPLAVGDSGDTGDRG
jgi:hypothetical protein